MSNQHQVTAILLRDLHFSGGKWQGNVEFILQNEKEELVGNIPFTYDRTWHLHAFKYPFAIYDEEREELKKQIMEKWALFSKEIEASFFTKREKFALKPSISVFEINDEVSNKERIYAKFKIENTKETFYVDITLVNNEWTYTFSTTNHSIDTYKTFYTWEDFLFERVIEKVNQHPKYRLKFVLHTKKYKYKYKYK